MANSQESEEFVMSNFSKVKNHAVVIDVERGILVQNIINPIQLDTYTHDVAEEFRRAFNIAPIAQIENLVLLVNDDTAPENTRLNPWATLLFGNQKREMEDKLYIFGDAHLLKNIDGKLSLLTKEEALDIALALRRKHLSLGGQTNG